MLKKKSDEYWQAKKKLAILATIFISIFVFGTIGYIITEKTTPDNAFRLTIETLAFIDHPDQGASKFVATALLVFGIIFVWFTTWTSLDIMLEGHFHKYFKEARFMDAIKKLSNHYIICGGGRVGIHVAEMLHDRGEKYVLIEKDEHPVKKARKKHYVALEGDALEEDVLKEANITKAKALIAVLPETEKNILITLTAKELNPRLTIYARSNKEEYVKKLKNAGADHVFMPELSCAEEIVKKIDKNF